MISIIHITNRGLYPLSGERWREFSQYQLLADALKDQTYTGWELIVVDKLNPLPRPELRCLGERVIYARPKWTPWNVLNSFQASVARNTGLEHAHGSVVLSLDDCVSFAPDLLWHVAYWAERGEYIWPLYQPEGREPHQLVEHPERCGGVVSYPREVAIAAGGWEERFSGCYALEDWEFSERLIRHGVRFRQIPQARVTLHKHPGRTGQYDRCAIAVKALVDGQDVANCAWTPEQLQVFTAATCPFSLEGVCIHDKRPCRCPKRPTPDVIRIMREYECSR